LLILKNKKMATSKKAVSLEETVDTTPEVMDFVDQTPELDFVIKSKSASTTITNDDISVTTNSLLDETGALTTRAWHK
jgi:hypothetical protein